MDPLGDKSLYANVIQRTDHDQDNPGGKTSPDARTTLSALALARLRFTATLDRPLQLPAHPGALLRGVFGAALRLGACTTGLPRCADCPLLRSCAYPAIFETPPQPTQFAQRFSQLPNPYVIEPPPGPAVLHVGDPLVFHMTLAGVATHRQLPLIVSAWQRALRGGLGQARISGRLLRVDTIDPQGQALPALDLATGRPGPAAPALDLAALVSAGPARPAGVALQLDTPLRLQHESKPLATAQVTPRVFMSHLLRRINLILDLHLDIRPAPFDARALLALADGLGWDGSGLQWQEQRRYSARQGQELPQGGVLGHWVWTGPVAPLLPWLLLGQWLHVGKGATAGLGGYRVLPLVPRAGA